MAWILFIVAVPFVGIVLYLVVGEVRPGSSRKRRHRTIVANIRKVLNEVGADRTDIVKLNTYWVHDGDDQDEFYKHMT